MTELPVMGSAFLAGVLAAAPVGPVNMVVIRRGLLLRWTRALWVAAGSMLVEVAYVALGLFGGPKLIAHFQSEALRRWAGLLGAAILLLIGLIILRKAVRHPHRVLPDGTDAAPPAPGPVLNDVLAGALLTVVNPLTLGYWLAAGPQLLKQSRISHGSPWTWALLAAAAAGLACWFLFICLLIRLRPEKVGPRFFRNVNILCGAILAVLGVVLAAGALF